MRKLHLLIVTLLLVMSVLAQQKTITGTVTSKTTNEPLQGVTVQAKNRTAITDAQGKFSIDASPGETITLTHVGLNPQRVKVSKGMEVISISMEEGAGGMEEVVVTGYKTER